MALDHNNPLRAELFAEDSIAPETRKINDDIHAAGIGKPAWWETTEGIPGVRAAALVRPKSPRARIISMPGKAGNTVTLRVVEPKSGTAKGVYYHIHGGWWCLGAADGNDAKLESIADTCGLAVASVEYRLAPENPYPAGPDDCETAAVWLVENAKREFGTDRLVIGGESAGGHLSAATAIRMRDRHGYTGFVAAYLHAGIYDVGMTPSQRQWGNEIRIGARSIDIEHYDAAFVPDAARRHDPEISPLYAKLHDLPPALFTIGTKDSLLDDSLFMHARWAAAGNQSQLEVFPGAHHGFQNTPSAQSDAGNQLMLDFLSQAAAGRPLPVPVSRR